MSEPDDAAWIAAAGAPRPEEGSADHHGVATATVESTVQDVNSHEQATPISDGDPVSGGQGGLWVVPEQSVNGADGGQPAVTGNGGETVSVASAAGVAGSSSPALRAMRGRDPEPAP